MHLPTPLHPLHRLLSPSSRPAYLSARCSPSFTIFVASYLVGVDIFLYGVIVPVLPFALHTRLHIAPSNLQHWVSILLAIYGGALLVTSLLVGVWADHVPLRRGPFLIGFAGLVASTLMLALARSVGVMVVARMLQGASSAVVWTVALVILTDRIGTVGLGKAMGWVAGARTVAIVAGPLLGGVVYANRGYGAVWGMVFGFIALDGVLRLLLVEARSARKWDPSVGPPKEPAEEPSSTLPTDDVEKTAATSSSPSSQLSSAPSPTPPPPRKKAIDRIPATLLIFTSPRPLIALFGCFWQAALLTAFDATLPLFVAATFRWSSSGAGLIFLALVLPSILSPLVGAISDKIGPKWPSVLGYILCGPPLIALRAITADTTRDKALLAVLLALVGSFATLFEIPLWVEIIVCVDEEVKARPDRFKGGPGSATGTAYGLTNFMFALGVVVGPVLAGWVYHSPGWGTMTLCLGVISVVTAVPTAFWSGGYLVGPRTKKQKRGKGEGETELNGGLDEVATKKAGEGETQVETSQEEPESQQQPHMEIGGHIRAVEGAQESKNGASKEDGLDIR